MTDYHKALSLIRSVFIDTRPRLLEAYGNVPFLNKSDTSPVIELDVAVENSLKHYLSAFTPGIGFYGEETANKTLNDTSWIIDPIDGTGAFIRGLPMCTNMVALMESNVIT